jgi:hypothetical protein
LDLSNGNTKSTGGIVSLFFFKKRKKKDVTPGVPGNISIYSTRHSTNVLIHKYIQKKAEESIGGGGGVHPRCGRPL